jgi:hypothetical protein
MVVALPIVPRLRWLAPAALAAGLIALLLLCWPVVSGPSRASLSQPSKTISGDLPSLRPTASQPTPALVGSRYRLTLIRSGFQGVNPAQGLSLRSAPLGIDVTTQAGPGVALTLAAAAMDGRTIALRERTESVEQNRILYDAGAVRESFLNEPLGVEQRFSVARSSHAGGCACITLTIVMSGALRPVLIAGGTQLILTGKRGPLFRYSKLSASDARGRHLRAEMRLRGARLTLEVQTAGARYPISVDPLLQPYTTLTGPSLPTSRFGSDIAVSEAGDTVAISGEGDNEGRGAVWVFTRSGESWVQDGPKLTPQPSALAPHPGRAGQFSHFGVSLAMSANGDTLLVGEREAVTPAPMAVWVFGRTDGIWRQQGPPLMPPSGEESSSVGIALSADGRTAVVPGTGRSWVFVRDGKRWRRERQPLPEAGPAALSANGRTLLLGTRVFVRSGSRWRPDGPKLPATNVEPAFWSVALSADGATALLGNISESDAADPGARRGYALLYRRKRGGWTLAARLSSAQQEGSLAFGATVALSGDGEIALVGAPPAYEAPKSTQGLALVYTRTGSNRWVQSAALSGIPGAVALSADGRLAIAPPNGEGSPARILTRSAANWEEQSETVAPSDAAGTPSDAFGGSFSISADGNTALVAEGDGAWVFGRVGTSWARQTRLEIEGATGGGTIVALAANGETAVVAGPSAPGPVAAWVFSRQGGSWTTHGTPLVAGGAGPRPPGSVQELERFASSVAVSGDGDTVLVGADWDSGNTGAAWVFDRSGAGWIQQGPKLTATSPSEGESFGDSVALSADGDVALIGAVGNRQRPPEGPPAEGAADVFARLAGVWTQTAKLTDGEHAYGWGLGNTVALSADGNTALIGAHDRAIIYYGGSSGWRQNHPALEPDPYEDNAAYGGTNAFGSIVALSADGTRALLGGPAEGGCGRYDNQPCSATATVWAFTRQAEAWVREPLPLVREVPFGAQAALSGDGKIGLVSGQTPGPEPGGAVFVSEITPIPESGFEVEPAPRVGYEGIVQIQLWSATPAHFKVVARGPSRQLYGTATSTGAGDLSLQLRPSRLFKRYFKRHKHLLLSITISQLPENHSAASTRTLTLPVTFEAFSPEV